jgi:hypothetical protein
VFLLLNIPASPSRDLLHRRNTSSAPSFRATNEFR